MDEIACKQCGGAMHHDAKTEKSIGLQIVGVFTFLLGLGMAFYFPFGTIVGVVIMLASLRLGYSKKKIWRCDGCGYFFERL